MFESGKKRNAAKKAYEIAYALFRISAKMEEVSIKSKLEAEAIDLLISANAEAYDHAARSLAAIEAIVKFSIDLNMVSIVNGDVLLREVSGMHEILVECLDKSDEVDVAKFFSSPMPMNVNTDDEDGSAGVPEEKNPYPVSTSTTTTPSRRNVDETGNAAKESFSSASQKKKDTAQEAVILARHGENEGRGISGGVFFEERKDVAEAPVISLKSGNRQIAILDRIRQSGNCKLRELQEVLPDCSERTLRYDLEDLIERNLVERVGSGGPAVFYRIRQTV